MLTDILRDEWGYTGLVMSDWWTRGEHYKELLAGNDLKMANGCPERVEEAMRLGAVSRSGLETARRQGLGYTTPHRGTRQKPGAIFYGNALFTNSFNFCCVGPGRKT